MRAPAQAAPSHWPAAAASLIRLGNDVATESPPFFRCVASARRNVPVSFGCCVVRSRAGGVLIRMSPAINMRRDAAAETLRADTQHTFSLIFEDWQTNLNFSNIKCTNLITLKERVNFLPFTRKVAKLGAFVVNWLQL